MKKFIITITILILVCSFCAQAEIYPQTFIVTDVNYNENILIMTDYNGYTWVWEGIEDLYIGDIIAAIVEDCNTKYIFDDIILDIRYAGYIDGWE